MILNIFLMVNTFLFWFYNNFYCTSRADIYLTAGAGKAVAAYLVAKVPLKGSAAFVTQYNMNQFIH